MDANTGFMVLIGGLSAPIILGLISAIFGDFSFGAGLGIFVMIGSWVIMLGAELDEMHNKKN